MTDLFTCRKYISNCPLIKQRAIWENVATRNCVLELWLVTENLRNTSYFASALDNVNNVNIFDMLAFVVILLFSTICSHQKITSGGDVHFQKVARLSKHPWGRFFYINFKKSLAEVSFYFHLRLRKTILERLLSYEITLIRKCKK